MPGPLTLQLLSLYHVVLFEIVYSCPIDVKSLVII